MREATRQAQKANREAMKKEGVREPRTEDFPVHMRVAIRNMSRR